MESEFRPYTKTHTLVFYNCKNLDRLLSCAGEASVDAWFGQLLLEAGWEVRRNPRTGQLRVMSDMFDYMGGYTAAAILGTSDVTIHTYPEKEYGATAEVEFNLCYLQPESVEHHTRALDRSIDLFCASFGSSGHNRANSQKRLLGI